MNERTRLYQKKDWNELVKGSVEKYKFQNKRILNSIQNLARIPTGIYNNKPVPIFINYQRNV
ncbi:hypothetical protein LEP1GSC062_2758 [Leptospira alexanderi serovar Manhao 3 str. L 60]|uniref:Uncharacterized protein n=1 Tax=Leptospira alexanderi serovar Manhao 3 str. L 60 TaxID=1049759 RepID=V6IG09_9LEPT|nr:hypothetical protein LEP1GSC062_2758 [Leptospira alexanderi serovar Manhao 3 str. L 60]